ncbi:hypothetical protein A3770_01p01160 [Chloropicon primus]|uniref:Uncharacterized protein n=1 Tax=Chloropicon primus TaxID=1764295 RepID=A0A5B8MAY5_9CHLO|nr:hypothetical protein A3770_01p01160 [Chloropicon primus]|eukprot:QDZ17598.1 hypothetical protein A3770_01p01160 [Chloropicon primus]
MYTKIQNMRSDLSDLDSGSSTPRKKKTKTNRISIDWESGHVYSAPASPFSTKKKPKRPQSAPPRQRIKATTSKPECRAYKEAIKDYICENSIYEEERLHELFESYKREKQKENEDVVIRAIEELKIELNVV